MQKTRKISSIYILRETSPGRYKKVPSLPLSGVWIDTYGFHIDSEVLITVSEDEIIISKKQNIKP